MFLLVPFFDEMPRRLVTSGGSYGHSLFEKLNIKKLRN